MVGDNGVVGANFQFNVAEMLAHTVANSVEFLRCSSGQARAHAIGAEHAGACATGLPWALARGGRILLKELVTGHKYVDSSVSSVSRT